MPLYEYHCKKCDKTFEVRQKFSDPLVSTCPACGGEVEKLISQSAFSLQGGGWYSDGYGSSKPTSGCPSGGSCSGCPSAS